MTFHVPEPASKPSYLTKELQRNTIANDVERFLARLTKRRPRLRITLPHRALATAMTT